MSILQWRLVRKTFGGAAFEKLGGLGEPLEKLYRPRPSNVRTTLATPFLI